MRVPVLFALAAATTIAACGGKPDPEQPAPIVATTTPSADSIARAARARQDSIDAENRRRADEEARRRAADLAGRSSQVLADLKAMINFDYNEAAVRAADQAILDRKAAIMQANPGLRIRISGHADERGSDEYNLALGNRRAAAAQRYLQNKGIDAARVDVISYGEERPLDPSGSEDAYAKNRRDEFDVTGGGDSLVAPQ